MSLPGTWRKRPSMSAATSLPALIRTPSPKARAIWLDVEIVSWHSSGHTWADSVTRARPSSVLANGATPRVPTG
ncbi:MAG: hypothetical protein AUH42_04805 [Gemmatimonadetes bacterium 13_1_40CM_70_11]|nr:MAG: hypothetical protein AUH42_04805 [Gemmatimonadetes bacterium 13_1_40CM_70_11]